MEEGAGLEGEVVEGEVGDGERGELIQGVLPSFKCLAGEFIHEVDGDVGDAGGFCEVNGVDCFLGCVEAAEGFEEGIVERLDADADAIDSGCAKRLHFFEGDVVGVGLECDFATTSDPA